MHYTHQQLFAGQKSISSSQRAAPDRIRGYIFLEYMPDLDFWLPTNERYLDLKHKMTQEVLRNED
jgi:hypothetical protein